MANRTGNQNQRDPDDAGINALELLHEDHEKVKSLFRDFDRAEDNDEDRTEILRQIVTELRIHSTIEKEIFYPALQAETDREGRELVDEALREHAEIEELIDDLDKLDVDDEQFESRFQELQDNVLHHTEEEEAEIFPEAEVILGDQIDQIGARMQSRKEELQEELGKAA